MRRISLWVCLAAVFMAACTRQAADDDPVQRAIDDHQKSSAPPTPYAGSIPDSGAARLTLRVRLL